MLNTAAGIIYNLFTSSSHRNDLHDLLGNEVTRHVFLLSPCVFPHTLGSWSRLHVFCVVWPGARRQHCKPLPKCFCEQGYTGELEMGVLCSSHTVPPPFLELNLSSTTNLVLSCLVFRDFPYWWTEFWAHNFHAPFHWVWKNKRVGRPKLRPHLQPCVNWKRVQSDS